MAGEIAPDFQIPFSIQGTEAKTKVSFATFMQFQTMQNLVEDTGTNDLGTLPPIPTLHDALGRPIQYDTATLEKFIRLFEISITTTTEDDSKLFTILEQEYTDFEEIKKFLILINYLDNTKFLNQLAKYSAILIRDGKVQL